MTKMKSRKMTKSTFAIIIMGIAMVAMLAFGGTFAYFTATAVPASLKATTATVKLGDGDIATSLSTNIVTGDVIADSVTFKNYSDVATYAVIEFSVQFTYDHDDDAQTPEVAVDVADAADVLSYHMDGNWTSYTVYQGQIAKVFYIRQLAAGSSAGTEIDVCGKITFVGSSRMVETYYAQAEGIQGQPGYHAADSYDWYEQNLLGTNHETAVAIMGKNVSVKLAAYAVQQENLVLTAAVIGSGTAENPQTPAVYVDPTPATAGEGHDGISQAEAAVIISEATGYTFTATAPANSGT